MHSTRSRPTGSLRAILALAIGLCLILGIPLTASGATTFSITLTRKASNTLFARPTQVTSAGDGSSRLYVVEERGTVRVVNAGVAQSGYFLDLRTKVESGGERGLLGLAFHPKFKTNHYLFVYYTRPGGDIVLARMTANATNTSVSLSTLRVLTVIEHSSASNHNGGGMAFGPNGYLYVAVGDGGGSGDPENDAQSKTRNFLGKVLRIDVNRVGSGIYGRYGIPPSNPFIGSITGLDEIWAYGLRNPWRISFDRSTGSLFIADVGQSLMEEVDREPSGIAGGRNYGWHVMEGTSCYTPSLCPLAGDTLPVATYTHTSGNCSITGGYVYRGTAYAKLVGLYVYADYCSGRIWTLPTAGTQANVVLRADTAAQITSFGESNTRELYAVTIDGKLYRIGTT